jgi:hypothetical protein
MSLVRELTNVIPPPPCLFRMANAVSSTIELANAVTSDSVNWFDFAMWASASKCFPIELVRYSDGCWRTWWQTIYTIPGLAIFTIPQCKWNPHEATYLGIFQAIGNFEPRFIKAHQQSTMICKVWSLKSPIKTGSFLEEIITSSDDVLMDVESDMAVGNGKLGIPTRETADSNDTVKQIAGSLILTQVLPVKKSDLSDNACIFVKLYTQTDWKTSVSNCSGLPGCGWGLGCYLEIRGTHRVRRRVWTGLRFYITVPTTLTPSQYLNSHIITIWSIYKISQIDAVFHLPFPDLRSDQYSLSRSEIMPKTLQKWVGFPCRSTTIDLIANRIMGDERGHQTAYSMYRLCHATMRTPIINRNKKCCLLRSFFCVETSIQWFGSWLEPARKLIREFGPVANSMNGWLCKTQFRNSTMHISVGQLAEAPQILLMLGGRSIVNGGHGIVSKYFANLGSWLVDCGLAVFHCP